ncbi:hypothetical protein RUND412_006107 [Rhizina undulata]
MAKIPTISLTDTPTCAAQLLDAAETLGFVHITLESSGITKEDVDGMFKISKEFFSLPATEKSASAITAANRGYSALQTEMLDPETQRFGDFKEALNIGEFTNNSSGLPSALLPHESFILRFQSLCHALSLKLLRLFAIALKIDESAGGAEYFTTSHTATATHPSGTILRLLHYPPIPNRPATDIRAGAHSDYGSLTLLFQRRGQGGLEILKRGWSPVEASEDRVLVNIGDLLTYWTAGVLRSTVHRVVFPADTGKEEGEGEGRYSMVYFCHPRDDTELGAIPSGVVRERVGRGANGGKVVTAGQHLEARLAVTYGWKGK